MQSLFTTKTPWQLGSQRTIAICVATFVLALGLRAGLHFGGLGFVYPDERDYLLIAHSLAERAAYDGGPTKQWPEYFRAPGLPYFLAVLFKFSVSIDAARWIVASLASFWPVLTFLTVRQLTQRLLPSLCAGLFCVFHPFHARASFQLTTDAITASLAALALLLFVMNVRNPGRRATLVAAGAALGVLVCFRTNLALFCLPMGAYWLWRTRRPPDEVSGGGRVWPVVVAFFAVVAPFVIARSVQEGRFLPLTEAGSEIFWRGNSSYTRSYLDGDAKADNYLNDYHSVVGDQWGKAGGPRRAYANAMLFIREHPREWLQLKARMLFETWRPWPTFREDEAIVGLALFWRAVIVALKACWYLLVAALLAWTLSRMHRILRDPLMLAFLGLLVMATAFGVVFFPGTRYRMPYDVVLVALCWGWRPASSSHS